jgi:SagB-type dehydrogenase family enzyme
MTMTVTQDRPAALRPSKPALGSVITLPPPTHGWTELDEALAGRRSIRAFRPDPVTDEALSRLLWAGQGVTDREGHRTVPSAGARYPLELYVVLPEGVAHYRPASHDLVLVRVADRRPRLAEAAWDQPLIAEAAVVLVIAAVYERTGAKYGPRRGPRYVLLEAGAACQSVLLETEALGLGAVVVGAFDDRRVQSVLGLPAEQQPLCLVAVGHPAKATEPRPATPRPDIG